MARRFRLRRTVFSHPPRYQRPLVPFGGPVGLAMALEAPPVPGRLGGVGRLDANDDQPLALVDQGGRKLKKRRQSGRRDLVATPVLGGGIMVVDNSWKAGADPESSPADTEELSADLARDLHAEERHAADAATLQVTIHGLQAELDASRAHAERLGDSLTAAYERIGALEGQLARAMGSSATPEGTAAGKLAAPAVAPSPAPSPCANTQGPNDAATEGGRAVEVMGGGGQAESKEPWTGPLIDSVPGLLHLAAEVAAEGAARLVEAGSRQLGAKGSELGAKSSSHHGPDVPEGDVPEGNGPEGDGAMVRFKSALVYVLRKLEVVDATAVALCAAADSEGIRLLPEAPAACPSPESTKEAESTAPGALHSPASDECAGTAPEAAPKPPARARSQVRVSFSTHDLSACQPPNVFVVGSERQQDELIDVLWELQAAQRPLLALMAQVRRTRCARRLQPPCAE